MDRGRHYNSGRAEINRRRAPLVGRPEIHEVKQAGRKPVDKLTA